MRYVTAFWGLLLTTAAISTAVASHSSFGFLGGSYFYAHKVSSLTGNDAKVTDSLRFEPAEKGYDFTLRLNFDYGGECRLSGFAPMDLEKETVPVVLTYRQPQEEVKTTRCKLNFSINRTEIRLQDPDYSCSDFCGLGGTVHDAVFSRDTRR